MNILLYRYGSICEPDIIDAFTQLGINVIQETTEMQNKRISNSDRIKIIDEYLKKEKPLFVFSINFYPAIAQICEIYQTLYLCWTVDSPVPELFSPAIKCSTNRIFLFDYAQYTLFHKYNPDNIFYLPLASCTERFDSVTQNISALNKEKYSSDISFVGSLYSDKNPLNRISGLSDYSKGYIEALVESSLQIYGYNPIEASITMDLANELKQCDSSFFSIEKEITDSTKYVAAHSYVGMQVAETERIRTLNALAEHFDVDLYTRSNTEKLVNVNVRGGVETLTEMPIVFHLSKINLNMTIKPIQTGLPLRIFDILGCGGFLMTNYQSELPDFFEIGTDIEAYSSMDELIDKCQYYLTHEDERVAIARNGYKKVQESHRYIHRISAMLKTIT